MISAIGVRNVVENNVDFTKSRNLIIAAAILVTALGFNAIGGLSFVVSGVTINLSGLAIAALIGIIMNAICPAKIISFQWNPHRIQGLIFPPLIQVKKVKLMKPHQLKLILYRRLIRAL